MGFTGNNGTSDLSAAASIAERTAVAPSTTGSFRGDKTTGTAWQDFASSYDPLNSYDQGSVAGSYTVQGGESLQQIAASLWGDANLWYRLAEANGLSGNQGLIAGQVLRLPAGVTRTAHNASTFKPYDPGEAIGDLSPTSPKPAKKNKCGVVGAILLAVVAIAAAKFIGPLAGKLFAQIGLKGLVATVATQAATGAAASIVSQGVGVATGIQDNFSWKAVGTAAVRSLFAPTATGDFAADVAFGVINEIAFQGIATATGLQERFDWAGVAAAGIGHAAGAQAGLATGNKYAALTANAIASAATRSAITGDSFGSGIKAAIPNIVAQAIGDIATSAWESYQQSRPAKAQASEGPEKIAEAAATSTDPGIQRPDMGTTYSPVSETNPAVIYLPGHSLYDPWLDEFLTVLDAFGEPEVATVSYGELQAARAAQTVAPGARRYDIVEGDSPEVVRAKNAAREYSEAQQQISTDPIIATPVPYSAEINADFHARNMADLKNGTLSARSLEANANAASGASGGWSVSWADLVATARSGEPITLQYTKYEDNPAHKQLLGKFIKSEGGTAFLHYVDDASFGIVNAYDGRAFEITERLNPEAAAIGQNIGLVTDIVGVKGIISLGAGAVLKNGLRNTDEVVEIAAESETVILNNGWRTLDGKFASPLSSVRPGGSAEVGVWDAIAAKPGWSVRTGNIAVRDASGQLRYYDGIAISPRDRIIGLEVKSGDASRNAAQRLFDTTLNSKPSNVATGVGQSTGTTVQRSILIRPGQ